ncbi:DUF2125 domain-containing protein [Elioraea sp.]|uniref:DUF2125 domain-containing protein n=1 Tax=Elioraea sp. TaxID=2185103 RepID=UPI0025BEFA36|nr:DUF2125 domain-containing protein [Elioraea sp.]
MTRCWGLIGGAVVATLVAAHGALWWAATGRLATEVDAWAAGQAQAGATVAFGEPRRAGYPVEARLVVPGFRYAGVVVAPGGSAVPMRAEARAIDLVLSPRKPREVVGEISCPCSIAVGQEAPVPITAAALRAIVPLGNAAAPVITGREVVLALPQGPLAIAELRATLPTDASRAQLDLAGIVLPPPESQWPLGSRIASLSAELTLRGRLPAAGGTARALRAWRDGDGRLTLDRLSLAWGPLTVQAAATMTLDRALQPVGAATARLAGYGPALDRFVAAGLIGRGQASLTRLALNAASRQPEGGGERIVEIPIAIEDRTLTAARIPLMRLPPIAWSP